MESLVELIAKKRDGGRLNDAQVQRLVSSYMTGELCDYQMSAFLMAVFFRSMDDAETVALTRAMLHSGDVIDLSSVPGIKVDKHSTGGVGDKVSICLAPLVAACGVPVPMVSGRGLGHTGGTLDKLEAIPGFSISLETAEFVRAVAEVKTAMIGQTSRIAPADKRMYALRDVTATVESIPLIVSSILSKKLAEGIDALVLDVKVGRGAFMKTHESAKALAEALVRVGTQAGKRVVALLTRMDAPLGLAIGNANETREAIEVLHGRGPADLVECTRALAVEMLLVGGVAQSIDEATTIFQRAIDSGAGARTMERMIERQGGDARVVENPSMLATAPIKIEVVAERDGFVAGIDSLELGLSAVELGAGRTRFDQAIDHAVGIDLVRKPGDSVRSGEVLCVVAARSGDVPVDRIRAAFTLDDSPREALPLVIERIVS